MKQQLKYKLFLFLTFLGLGLSAQKETKTFIENFNVSDNVVLNVNTIHTDIEFETWNKKQVEVTVTIEIEGAQKSETEAYFNQNKITVKGNSKQVDINTKVEDNSVFINSLATHINAPPEFDIPQITALPNIAFLDSLQMPPVPPVPVPNFDYEAFEKEGDAYVKKWQNEFDKGFDREYMQKVEAWQKRAEEQMEIAQIQMMEADKQMGKANLQIIESYEQLNEIEKGNKVTEEELENLESYLKLTEDELTNSFYTSRPNVFYLSSTQKGSNNKIKVKKSIIIKMPKSASIQMNVRHGEVKLAENTKNIKAILSYSNLLANTIEGTQTRIEASYSPVNVQNWNFGKLKLDYADDVVLNKVKDIIMFANSSEIRIGQLLNSANLENSFGSLTINMIDPNFSSLELDLKNADLRCKIPKTSFTIQVNEVESELIKPDYLVLKKNKNKDYLGYNISNDSGKTINITSNYSNVVLE
jgi:hypothetical protein